MLVSAVCNNSEEIWVPSLKSHPLSKMYSTENRNLHLAGGATRARSGRSLK